MIRCKDWLETKALFLIFGSTLLFLVVGDATAQSIVDEARYTLRRPADGWQQAGFEDAGWKKGNGGFGMSGTPGARIGTNWGTNHIWLRKKYTLQHVPEKPALLIHHDEDAEIFLNGQLITKVTGFVKDYLVISFPETKKNLVKPGENILAVHCRQTTGGQFIDVHLIDAGQVPSLPRPQRSTKPFQSELMTIWGEEVVAENAWTEYPRPMMKRQQWKNLNGHWDYAITPIAQQDLPQSWQGKILVPFCLESKLGGVQRLLDREQALWYRTQFSTDAQNSTLLNFEAVDYQCRVFINGHQVGSHRGGNLPFSFDVTDSVVEGANELVVRVVDKQEGFQLHGKQTLNPRGIWYTQVSGIWQTVWIETVNASRISDLKISTDPKQGQITVLPMTVGDASQISLVIKDGDQVVAESGNVDANRPISLQIPSAKLWSPSQPFLYLLELELSDASGNVVDEVQSYAGIRSVGKTRDDAGNWRFTLNDKVIFHWGPLDQGWWPDGLLTPPSDEAMLFEIEWLKSAGFNMIRKHIKVEPRRYYYHCDRLGMLVWQDHVSGGPNPKWTRLLPDPADADWPDEHHQQFMNELRQMVDGLSNHPSIVCWVPFNEAWGQHRTVEVGRWIQKYDPTRLINIASGGNFWPVGDIVDAHKYPHPEFPFETGAGGRFDDFIKVMGEFGGHGYPVAGHLWDADRRNWGYGGLPKNEAEYKQRYVTSLKMLDQLQNQGIAGGVYTQTTDVEGEINGLMTYDRKVIKISAEALRELHKSLFD